MNFSSLVKSLIVGFSSDDEMMTSPPPRGTDSVLIKFVKEFDICGAFELFSMKIKIESAQN